jgi:DNA-binding beta-propeller fold protein YncE
MGIRMFSLGLVSICLVAEGADFAPLKLVTTIPLAGVNGRFDHFSIDVKGNRLFVAALGNDTVEVIDLAAGRRSQSVSGMSKPQGVLFVARRNELLVANGENGTLKVLDATDFKVKKTFRDLPDADNVRLDRNSGAAWVGYGDGALAQVAPAQQEVMARIKLPGHPESFQFERDGSRIFINIPDANQIAIVDAKNHEIVRKCPMEKFRANFPMALDEAEHRLFVGCRRPARLAIFDTQSGKQVLDLPISGDTDDLFYDTRRRRVYVSCGEGFIDIVSQESADAYTPLAKVQTASGARTSFFSSELDRLYLAVPERGTQKAEIRVYRPDP